MEALTAELSAAATELQQQAARVDQQHREACEELRQLQQRNSALQSAVTEISGEAAATHLQLRSLSGGIEAARGRQDVARSRIQPAALQQYAAGQRADTTRDQAIATRRLTDKRRNQVEQWQQQRHREGRERVEANNVQQQRRALARLQRRRSRLGSPARLAALAHTLTTTAGGFEARARQMIKGCAQLSKDSEGGPGTDDKNHRFHDYELELSALDDEMQLLLLKMLQLRNELLAEKKLLGMGAGLEGENVEEDLNMEELTICGEASTEDTRSEDDIIDVDSVCVATENYSIDPVCSQAQCVSAARPPATVSARGTSVAEVTVRARLAAGQRRRERLSRQVEQLEEQVMLAKRTLEAQA